MEKLRRIMYEITPTALLVLGAAAVSVGIGMVWLPVGVIAAGALAITGGVLVSLGRGGGKK